jgi:hypothetical protein
MIKEFLNNNYRIQRQVLYVASGCRKMERKCKCKWTLYETKATGISEERFVRFMRAKAAVPQYIM